MQSAIPLAPDPDPPVAQLAANLTEATTAAEATARVVLVPLRGKYGDGRAFVLDAADWPAVRDTWAGLWSLARTGRRFYVVGKYPPVAGTSTAHLARWLVGAGRGDMVQYADGDTLNLRRANLRLLRGEDRTAWFRKQAVPAVPAPADTPDVEAARALLAGKGFKVLKQGQREQAA